MSKKRYCITATAFDRKGRVLCSSNNSYRDSCSLMRYYAMKTGNFKKVFNHAEIACLAKALKMRKDVDKMVVIRYDCNGSMKSALPCEVYQAALKDFKVRKVFYSTESGIKELVI